MILVTGATGHVGRHVVNQLLDEDVPVRTLTRDPDTARLPAGAEVVGGDLADPAGLAPHVSDVDTVFLVWPLHNTDAAPQLLDLLAQRNSHVVYLSSEGVPSDPADAGDPITGMHATLEGYIRGRNLAWTFLRPTGFASNTLGWAGQIRTGDTVRWPFGSLARPLIHERDIAAVAVHALIDGHSEGQIHHLSGPALVTQAEQVRAIGEALGRPLRFTEQPLPEAREQLTAAFGDAGVADGVLAAWSTMVTDPEAITNSVEELTGVAPRTFRQWAFEHSASFG